MSKSTLLAFGAGVVLVAGLTVYTSYEYQQQMEKALAETKENLPPEAQVELTTQSDLIVFRADKYSFKFEVGTQQERKPMAFGVDIGCTVLPLYVSCQGQFDSQFKAFIKSDLAEIPEVAHELTWNVNLWADSLSGKFHSEAFEVKDEDGQMSIGAINMDFSGDAKTTYMDSSFVWEGLKVEGLSKKGKKFQTRVGEFTMSGHSEKRDGYFMIGDGTGKLQYVQVDGADGEQLDMSPMTISYSLNMVDEQKTQINYETKMDAINFKQGEASHQVKDVVMSMSLNGLSYENLVALQKVNAQGENADVLGLLDQIGQDAMQLKLEDVSGSYNGMPVSVVGEVASKPFTSMEVMTRPGNITILSGELQLLLGQKVSELFPQIAPQLGMFEQANYVSRNEQGDYQTKLTLKEGLISANGQPLQNLLDQ